MPASRTPPRRAIAEPRLILLATGAAGLMIACVVGIILTGDVWLVVVTLLAMGLLAGIVDLDLRRVVDRSGDAHDEAPPAFAIPAGGERVIVVTSEPAT